MPPTRRTSITGNRGSVRVDGSLDHPLLVARMAQAFKNAGADLTNSTLDIYVENVERAFPNVKVPIAALIDDYASNRKCDVALENSAHAYHLDDMLDPLDWPGGLNRADTMLGRIWKFDSETAVELADAIVRAVLERAVLSDSSYDAFNWCLWEIMDNVLIHSKSETRFVEVQVHPSTQFLALCVADHGIGIRNSFIGSRHRPNSDIDAITLALKRGVTRDPKTNQGNGLFGLHQIAAKYGGTLNITSGRGLVRIASGSLQTGSLKAPLTISPCTVIDFLIPIRSDMNIVEVLGHKPTNMLVENLAEMGDQKLVKVQDASAGFGTRKAGAQMKNFAMNIIEQSASPILLDFDGVPLISSSFADEFVGKMVQELGFMKFNRLVSIILVSIINANPTVEGLIEHSVALRMTTNVEPSDE